MPEQGGVGPSFDGIGEGSASRTAAVERLGASSVRLDDQGHWWMVGDPASAAGAIAGFWDALD